jgi:hypothetical protein
VQATLKIGTTLLCLSLAFVSCSGGSSIPRPTAHSSAAQQSGQRTYYLVMARGKLPPVATTPPLSDSSALALRQAAHNPPSDLAATQVFLNARRTWTGQHPNGRTVSNYVLGNQQYGVAGYNQTGITGMRGTHSAYNSVLFAAFSQGATGQLYAPTGKPGNGCIEVGTENFPGSGRPPNVYAFDFCDGTSPIGSFTRLVWIDPGSVYVRTISGIPSYTFQSLRNPDGKWTVYLYNFSTGAFDPLYTSPDNRYRPGMAGWQQTTLWDMFEPKVQDDVTGLTPCMGTPPVVSSGLAELTPSGWARLDALPDISTNAGSTTPSCFGSDDGSGVGYYYFFALADYSDWSVGAYVSQPPPPPPPSGCDPNVDPLACCDPSVSACCDPTLGACCIALTCLPPCIGFNCACPTDISGGSPNCGPGDIIYSVRRRPTSWRSTPSSGRPNPARPDLLLRTPSS